MSIARERREIAAALALLVRGKLMSLEAASERQDDEATQDAALDLAMLFQNNSHFILGLLEHYAGSMKDLPGGIKKPILTPPTLAEAVQTDIKNDS
jgi:hypothetical protein